MAIRRPVETPPVVADCVAAIALGGWSGRPPGPAHRPCSACWDAFFDNEAGMARLWREHETHLRGKAREWGVEPEDGDDDDPSAGRMFFAESCARREALGERLRPL